MSYSVDLLKTPAECDFLLTNAGSVKDDLTYRRITLVRHKAAASETAVEVDDELVAINAEVTNLTAVVASLPDGALKTENIGKLLKAQVKQFQLVEKDKNYSSLMLLMMELEIAQVDRDTEEADAFIAEINARKSSL